MAKKTASPAPDSPLPLAEGIKQIRTVRVIPTAAQLAEFASVLPAPLQKVVNGSLEAMGSSLIPTYSPGILKLKRADLKKVFAHFFPDFAEAAIVAFEKGNTKPIISVDTYPHRSRTDQKRNQIRHVQWWATLAHARLEFPAQYFNLETLAKWAPYMDLGVETDIQDAIGQILAEVIDTGGKDAERLRATLVSSVSGNAPQVLLGGQVIFALWGSADPELNELIHQALFEKRFVEYRRHILCGAVKTSADRLLPLIDDIFKSKLLSDKDFRSTVEDVLGLSDVFPAISAKKADRDQVMQYLANRANGIRQKPIAWLDSYWEAWATSVRDIDQAVPLLSRFVQSKDLKTRLAAMALAEKLHVHDLLQEVKPSSKEESLTTILKTMQLTSRADTSKLSDAERKTRLAEAIAIYQRTVDHPEELKALGQTKSRDLFSLIERRLGEHWGDESLTIIGPLLDQRELVLGMIVPEDYVVPDDETAEILLKRIKIVIEWEEGYLDNLEDARRSMNALLRSDLSLASWIRFLQHVHCEHYDLPANVVARLNKLPSPLLSDIIKTLFAAETPQHRLAALKIAVACAGKHAKAIAKLKPKLVPSMPKPRGAQQQLLAQLEARLLEQLE